MKCSECGGRLVATNSLEESGWVELIQCDECGHIEGECKNMNKYLAHYNGKGRIIHLNTRETSSEDFGRIQREFALEAGAKEKPEGSREYADTWRLYEDQQEEGIYYNYDLCCDGGLYTIYAMPTVSKAKIALCKQQMRSKFDVVRVYTVKIKELI